MTRNGQSLVLLHCAACDNVQERWQDAYCTQCWSQQLRERDASGSGTLVSWVVYHKDYGMDGFTPPYAIGWVRLEEGPHIACLLDGDWSQARPNHKIQITVAEAHSGRGNRHTKGDGGSGLHDLVGRVFVSNGDQLAEDAS